MRRVLIVSPHFPPTNAPDHQRVRMSLPHFRANAWDPVVLAVDAADVEAPQDPLLADTLPADVPVHRVHALPALLTRLAGFGNVAYRSWFQLKSAGDRLLREGKFDLVYFSTTQFVATALGRRWRQEFGVPFVVDLQDPWRTDYYDRPGAPPPPGGWKYRLARRQAARLEEPSWRDASGFISVSEDYLAHLRARYAWFAAKPAAVIPFAAPDDDFEFVRNRPDIAPAFVREPGTVNVVSVGAVGPIMRTALELLFAGLRNLRAVDPAAATLRLHFIGTSYARGGQAQLSVVPVAHACDVDELVREDPRRVGYFTAIQTLLAANAVVIPGSDDPAYNPSKIGTCFLAARPTLALTSAGSAFERAVRELAFADVVTWPAAEGVTRVTEFFRRLLRESSANNAVPGSRTPLAAFTARARTTQQCELFDRALATHP